MFIKMCSNDGDSTQKSDFRIVFHNRCVIYRFLKLETGVFASIPTDIDISKKQKKKKNPNSLLWHIPNTKNWFSVLCLYNTLYHWFSYNKQNKQRNSIRQLATKIIFIWIVKRFRCVSEHNIIFIEITIFYYYCL